MSTTVDDVHHRNGECIGVAATDVAIQGQTQGVGSSLGSSQGDTEDGIGTELALGGCAVEGKHLIVESALVEHAVTLQGGSDDGVDILNSLQRTLAEVAVLVAVAKLQSLVLTGGCTRGNSCTAHNTVLQHYVNFYCRITT